MCWTQQHRWHRRGAVLGGVAAVGSLLRSSQEGPPPSVLFVRQGSPQIWLTEHQPSSTLLFLALQALLTWLLSMVQTCVPLHTTQSCGTPELCTQFDRKSKVRGCQKLGARNPKTPAWRAMKMEHGRQRRDAELRSSSLGSHPSHLPHQPRSPTHPPSSPRVRCPHPSSPAVLRRLRASWKDPEHPPLANSASSTQTHVRDDLRSGAVLALPGDHTTQRAAAPPHPHEITSIEHEDRNAYGAWAQ